MTAATLHLGYFASLVLFAALFVLAGVGYRLGVNAVFAFWFAYVMTGRSVPRSPIGSASRI